jgi:predicted secreted protein
MTHPSRRVLMTLALAMSLAAAARPAAAETRLRLSEQARVQVRPDTLAATLRIEAESATASDAQSRVNAQTAKAIALARQADKVVATTGAYNVWRATQPSPRWHAVQTVELRGGDGPAMLALVGTLQDQGMTVQQLGWRLSREAARKAQSEATKDALRALRARAEEAAGILGLRFVEFREVRLDGNPPSPRPVPQMAMALGRGGAAPPVAETEDIAVEASIGADAVLVPR